MLKLFLLTLFIITSQGLLLGNTPNPNSGITPNEVALYLTVLSSLFFIFLFNKEYIKIFFNSIFVFTSISLIFSTSHLI